MKATLKAGKKIVHDYNWVHSNPIYYIIVVIWNVTDGKNIVFMFINNNVYS